MVFLSLLLFGVIAFLAISLVSKELREKTVSKAKGIVDTVFNKAPIIADNVVIDPLKERINRLKSGSGIGSIRVEAGDLQ